MGALIIRGRQSCSETSLSPAEVSNPSLLAWTLVLGAWCKMFLASGLNDPHGAYGSYAIFESKSDLVHGSYFVVDLVLSLKVRRVPFMDCPHACHLNLPAPAGRNKA